MPCVIKLGPREEKLATVGAAASITAALFFTVTIGTLHTNILLRAY